MELWHVAAALLSAFLHAAWNAAVKVGNKPVEVMTAQMAMAALLVVPGLVWTGLPAPAAWHWLALSTCLNIVAVSALLKAYELVGFGLGYPIIRAMSVLLLAPATVLLSGDSLSRAGIGGLVMMAAALFMLGVGSRKDTPFPRMAVIWIAAAAICGAANILTDAKGVRVSGSPWAYGYTVSITNAIVMLAKQTFGGAHPLHLLRQHAAKALPIAIASVTSYQLILLVYANAPVAPAAALRDLSAIFAVLISVLWLREPLTRSRLVAMALAACAVPLLRFA